MRAGRETGLKWGGVARADRQPTFTIFPHFHHFSPNFSPKLPNFLILFLTSNLTTAPVLFNLPPQIAPSPTLLSLLHYLSFLRSYIHRYYKTSPAFSFFSLVPLPSLSTSLTPLLLPLPLPHYHNDLYTILQHPLFSQESDT